MERVTPYRPDLLFTMGEQKTRSGQEGIQIAVPLGGIGSGCICINGSGGLQDFSIKGTPETSAVPDSFNPQPSAFAMIHIKGDRVINRVLEGPVPREKIYSFGLKAQGMIQGGQEGLPHYENCTFRGEFPFAYVSLSEQGVPVAVDITAFNPFIPLDDRNSSIPCAIVEYTLTNTSDKSVDFEFSYNMSHPSTPTGVSVVIPNTGVFMYNTQDPNSDLFGGCAFGSVGSDPLIQGMWFQAGWFDSLTVLWKQLLSGTLSPNNGTNGTVLNGINGGTLFLQGSLEPGESKTYPIVLTWYFPNRNTSYCQSKQAREACCGGSSGTSDADAPKWKTYYSSQWTDARDVLSYVIENYESLKLRTREFHDNLFESTIPDYVLEAVSANLAVLKSPTILREANGNIWGFEGCFSLNGCCDGTCTHVYNYAQAMAHLFPQLERTLRALELERSMDDNGHVAFRGALPDGPANQKKPAAADGQLGGIMKVYRDYLICGDLDWLKHYYPLAKKSLDYCIATWDPDHLGVVIEPHMNTYDFDLWGPEGMCSSIYIGALTAFSLMAVEVGKPEDAPYYQQLAARGVQYMDQKIFNGEYYYQKVMYENLNDQSFMNEISVPEAEMTPLQRLMKEEGPNYQFGTGCLSDGVIGAWMAKIYGIPMPLTLPNVRESLKSIFDYNFKKDLWEHATPQRPGYAMGHDPGLLLCTWPNGGRPTLPIVYSDEVWTGIEFQVASHLIEEGFLEEGLTIVKANRTRYDGFTRNPWNSYLCGNYYARAMASYALLNSLSGFRYARPTKTLWFGPKLNLDKVITFFSTETGFGRIVVINNKLKIRLTEGYLDVEKLIYTDSHGTQEIACSIHAVPGMKGVIPLTGQRTPLA